MRQMRHAHALRLLSLLLVLLQGVPLLCGCSRTSAPIEATEEEMRAVGNVGDYEVAYDEYRFAVLTCRGMLTEEYGESFLQSADAKERILENVLSNITYNYAVLTLCAEVGILPDNETLLEAVQQKVDKTVEELGSRRKYRRYLEENGLTDRLYRFNLMVDLMQNELFYVYVDDLGLIESEDAEVYDIILKEFINVSHIYVSKATEGAYERICQAQSRLQNGEDFAALVAEYNEDDGQTEGGDCIPRGYMSEPYENAAFSLGVGSISDVVEDSNGYYIIRRGTVDTGYVLMHFDTLADRYRSYAFLDMIEKEQAKLQLVFNSYGASLDALTLS